MDNPADDADGARWMTYRELGQARGISRSSAERLARRLKWPRQAGNDGFARVLVPEAWLSLTDDLPDIGGRRTDALATLRVSVENSRQQTELLRERLARADDRADKAEAKAAQLAEAKLQAEGRVSELTADLDRAREDITVTRQAVEQARAATQAAEGKADAMGQEISRLRTGGRLARAWRAWRNLPK